jgi:putative hydrolase of the HAD superfamily
MKLVALFRSLGVHDVVVSRVAELRAEGYKTAILTNNVREASADWRAMLDVDALFDVVIDSSEVGMRKPNPAIYLLALEQLGVDDPSRAVFIDDAPGNVEGARAAGLHALLFEDAESCLTALDLLLEG